MNEHEWSEILNEAQKRELAVRMAKGHASASSAQAFAEARETRYCVDCEHFSRSPHANNAEFAHCDALEIVNDTLTLVTGKAQRETVYCTSARATGGQCGPEGKLFKKKERPF